MGKSKQLSSWAFVAFCLGTFLSFSCKKEQNNPQTLALTLSVSEKIICVGESFTITAYKDEARTQEIPPQEISWQSLNSQTATISAGVVQALTPGETRIKALYQGQETYCKIRVIPNYKTEKGMPYLQWGRSLDAVRTFEKERGNEPYLSGEVEGEEGMTYLTILVKNDPNSVLYDYFFENNQLVEAQWYTNKFEEYWDLTDGGKITPKAKQLVESWGFRFYGYDNSLPYPTAVAWNPFDQVLCSFGPRFRSQKSLFMFNFFISEEPQVEGSSSATEIKAETEAPVGTKIQIGITSPSSFKIDWGNGTTQTYPSGKYDWEKPLSGATQGTHIRIIGEGIEEVSLMGCRLTDLKIENGQSLKELRCPANQLTSLDLTGCQQLEFLNCANNQIRDLNIQGLKKLKEMHLFRNALAEIDLSDCSQLELLYAYKNQLSQLNASHLKALRYLHLSNNKLSSFDLSHHPSLIECQLKGNQLEKLILSSLYPNLLTIDLSDNRFNAEILNQAIDALPNVSQISVNPDEESWKKVCTLSKNDGFEKASINRAIDKGWIVK